MPADTLQVVIHLGNPIEAALGVGLVVIGLILLSAFISATFEVFPVGRDDRGGAS
jgi:hypothetical protein